MKVDECRRTSSFASSSDYLETGGIAPDRHLDAVLDGLNLEEKLKLLTGADLWHLAPFPGSNHRLTLSDGPHGLRKPVTELSFTQSIPSTCFPTAAALSCSWNVDLVKKVGLALRDECRNQNVQILLGPGVNIKRHPGGGRVFEYWSEDPFLTARLATAFCQGIQEGGHVGCCVKHVAVNNQESHRFVVNAVVDERTAHEIYLRHFEYIIKNAQPASVMCAYNRINGVYCSEHAQLFTELMRNQWRYNGIVMTDWGATNSRVAGIAAGIDLEMPGSFGVHDLSVAKALEEGHISMEQVNACCKRMLQLMQKFPCSRSDEEAAESFPLDWTRQNKVAKEAAIECAVLLKNDNECLPIPNSSSIAIIGEFGYSHPRFQGMGSSRVNPKQLSNILEAVRRCCPDVKYAPGYECDDDSTDVITNHGMIDDAVDVARGVDLVVLCVGLPEIMESEGLDRPHLSIPKSHTALIEAVSNVHSNIVVVLSNGGVVEVPWVDKVQAIVEGYLLGQASGDAIAEILYGRANPSGKLAESFPLSLQDIPANNHFPGEETLVEYREGLNVGYRFLDTAKKQVRFPFGHGLSYTSFSYSEFHLKRHGDAVECSIILKNTGNRQGQEVVQFYVHDVESTVYRPEQELQGFQKVMLEPGESQKVQMTFSNDNFAVYDVGVSKWVVESGQFEIRVGSSSRDIRLLGTIEIMGAALSEASQKSYPCPQGNDICPMDNDSFQRRFDFHTGFFNRDMQEDVATPSDLVTSAIHRNSLLKTSASRSWLGWLLMTIVYKAAARDIENGPRRLREERMVKANTENIPLRVLVLFSRGGLNFTLLDALIAFMNGFLVVGFKGLVRAVLGIFRRSRVR